MQPLIREIKRVDLLGDKNSVVSELDRRLSDQSSIERLPMGGQAAYIHNIYIYYT